MVRAQFKDWIQKQVVRLQNSAIFKGFAITTIGSGLSKAIMIAATFWCTHSLSQEEFGEYSFINNTLVMVLTICASNFSRLCTKFAAEAKESEDSIKRLFILFLFSLTACLLSGLLILLLPDIILESVLGTTQMLKFLRFSALLLPLFMLNPLIEGVLRGLMKFKIISLVQIAAATIYFSSLIIGIKLSGLDGALVALLVYYTTFSVSFLICLIRSTPSILSFERFSGFKNQWRVLPTMIIPIFVASFIEAPMFWIMQVMLTKYSSVAAVGGMTIMKQVRNLALLIPNYFFFFFLSFAGKYNAEKNYKLYFSQFDRFIKYFLVIGILLFVLLSILNKPILWLYHPDYMTEWKSLIISSACIPFSLVLSLVRNDLIIQEHQRALLIISILWNFIWIALFVSLARLGIPSLESYFYSELCAIVLQLIICLGIYNRDKNTLLPVSK